MKTMPNFLIWLDDLRDPFHPDWVKWLSQYSPIPPPYEIVWAKSYEKFVEWIKSYGLPEGICFDHDLGSDISREKVKNGMSKKQARKEQKGTKSGMDAAKWLVEYCLDNNLELPLFSIQSANTCGKENIDGLLKSFNNRSK